MYALGLQLLKGVATLGLEGLNGVKIFSAVV